MTVYHATTLDLLAHELDRQRRSQADADATAARWLAEMPSMGTAIADMTRRGEEFGAVIDDLESLLAIAQGANAAEAEFTNAKSGAGR